METGLLFFYLANYSTQILQDSSLSSDNLWSLDTFSAWPWCWGWHSRWRSCRDLKLDFSQSMTKSSHLKIIAFLWGKGNPGRCLQVFFAVNFMEFTVCSGRICSTQPLQNNSHTSRKWCITTPPKTNMAPENQWLEAGRWNLPIEWSLFKGHVSFQGGG